MTVPRNIQKYLNRWSVVDRWCIVSRSLEGIDTVVVIPALAESKHLFTTLASLEKNPLAELERTLVICVVNNGPSSAASGKDVTDNRETLKRLQGLVDSDENGLRVGYVDASSPGMEMPEKTAGVGLARKIGMDLALGVFDYGNNRPPIICSLDADTLVEPTYLSAVRKAFEQDKVTAAVIAFAHQAADRTDEQSAICCYELFLRYYVLGLRYAGSPYAFHSIGSTMVCSAESYAAVRGMNTRRAGEDFYFLEKLAKTGRMGRITATTIHPSARASERVPFGTGKRVIRFTEGEANEYLLYDPQCFEVLKEWLSHMLSCTDQDPEVVLTCAGEIHQNLEAFLRSRRFAEAWPRLVENSGDEAHLRDHFARWFDGFETFKLIRYLTNTVFPPVNMFAALEALTIVTGGELPITLDRDSVPPLRDQMKVLASMRAIDDGGQYGSCSVSGPCDIS